MLISVSGSTLHQCGFYQAVCLHKLHQNVWQRVSGLYRDPVESPRGEGKKGGLTEEERWPQAWTPKIYARSPPLKITNVLYVLSLSKSFYVQIIITIKLFSGVFEKKKNLLQHYKNTNVYYLMSQPET